MTAGPRFDLVLFGGTGDLALRKLLPGLYYRHCDRTATPGSRVIGIARQDLTRDAYLALVEEHCRRHIAADKFEEGCWREFAACLDFVRVDGRSGDGMADLAARLGTQPAGTRVFYLATASTLFADTCEQLARAGLITPTSRVVLEKPLGTDGASADAINARIGALFTEQQVFRIDHYLGKETVQNLVALRFGNSIFEPLWDRTAVRDVQITIAERMGVGTEGRAEYYDHYGALRDMVQNHLLQLLCMLAMEPPASLDADALRDEKLKVVRALRPFTPEAVRDKIVRGQYRAGAVNGTPVPGYLEEPGVPADSLTETYVALRADLDNWRWAGVPFYLRTGKRMAERLAEIVLNFRPVPHAILPGGAATEVNRLIIRLQPDESIRLYVLAKVPGAEMKVRRVPLNLDFESTFKVRRWDAYERLLSDVIAGNLTLFMRRDELDASWDWIDPIQRAWAQAGDAPRPYAAGSWGPSAANALIARDGLSWQEDS